MLAAAGIDSNALTVAVALAGVTTVIPTMFYERLVRRLLAWGWGRIAEGLPKRPQEPPGTARGVFAWGMFLLETFLALWDVRVLVLFAAFVGLAVIVPLVVFAYLISGFYNLLV